MFQKLSLAFCQSADKHLHFSRIVLFLFWYIAHNWNYGILATSAQTIVNTHLNYMVGIQFLKYDQ